PVPLAELEAPAENLVTLELDLIVEDPDHSTRKIVYQDFGAGWTVDLTAEPAITTAEIVQIGKPQIGTVEGVPEMTYYNVDLTVAYSLAGYDEAVLVTGYEYNDGTSSSGGYDVTPIRAGKDDQVVITLQLDKSLINDSGEVIEGVNFFTRINGYDETAEEWVNLYPGDAALSDGELSLPYPYLQDAFSVASSAWTTDALGQPVLNVTVGYHLVSQPTAEIVVDVTGNGGGSLASGTAAIEAGDGSLTIPISFNQAQLANNQAVQITAVLTAGEVEIEDELSAVYLSWKETAGNEVQILGYEVVTRTTENGVAADITLHVGYNLSEEYSGGRIAFSNEYQASTYGGGNGGGGGSQSMISTGSGTTDFVFGFETTSRAVAQDWLQTMSTSIKLYGTTAAGEEVLVGEAYKVGTE
ncbi:MAG: hypothetical protein WAM60_12835, partial [Candidatus Promineifilaceae bacterium]